MRVVETIEEMQSACRALRMAQHSLGLVPTMGALHAGHLSLVGAARSACQATAVSIFVNPTQFGPNEDLAKYPRTFDADCALLKAEGVDLVFAPAVAEMYPAGASTFVDPGPLGDRLDGISRPGHFRGVATVVSKLFHIVTPTHAFFGQKDAAQLAVLRAMVRDLNFDLEIVACPIVREPDGLAMSSRNRFLNGNERKQAPALSRALGAAELLIAAGERSPEKLQAAIRSILSEVEQIRIDYVAIVDAATLEEIYEVQTGSLIAIAAIIGTTRLIDNIVISHKVDSAPH